jgi:hypothetical protein
MIADLGLLSELNELESTRVHKWLQDRREKAVKSISGSRLDRDCNILIGGLRELDDILNEIETASDQHAKIRADKENRVDMDKAF